MWCLCHNYLHFSCICQFSIFIVCLLVLVFAKLLKLYFSILFYKHATTCYKLSGNKRVTVKSVQDYVFSAASLIHRCWEEPFWFARFMELEISQDVCGIPQTASSLKFIQWTQAVVVISDLIYSQPNLCSQLCQPWYDSHFCNSLLCITGPKVIIFSYLPVYYRDASGCWYPGCNACDYF